MCIKEKVLRQARTRHTRPEKKKRKETERIILR